MQKDFKSKKNSAHSRHSRPESEFDQELIDIARVTRVMAGGKRMRFRAAVALGDKKGQVGFAIAKGADVTIAINKAVVLAKKNLIKVNIVNDTIPYPIVKKYKAGKILLKPAPRGTGIKAGGSVRQILVLAGINNVTSKILGTNNKITNALTTLAALQDLKKVEPREQKPEEKSKKEPSLK